MPAAEIQHVFDNATPNGASTFTADLNGLGQSLTFVANDYAEDTLVDLTLPLSITFHLTTTSAPTGDLITITDPSGPTIHFKAAMATDTLNLNEGLTAAEPFTTIPASGTTFW